MGISPDNTQGSSTHLVGGELSTAKGRVLRRRGLPLRWGQSAWMPGTIYARAFVAYALSY